MSRARRLTLALVAFMALLALAAQPPLPASAQQRQQQRAAPQPPAPPPPDNDATPPYEPQLLKLAEIMGSLAYLRTLCTAREAPDWRERMSALLDAEGRTQQRRDRLASAYNRGFRAYSATHRSCTQGSLEASGRLAAEGEKLTRSLAGRFGG